MMNSTMNSECGSLEDGDLQIELSNSSGFKDGLSPNYDDELMYALDTLEEHANDSIQATRDSELHWIQILQERDELIESKEKSIEHLQRLNERLEAENRYLLQQVLELNGDITDSASSKATVQLPNQAVKEDEAKAVDEMRKQNSLLSKRLTQSGRDCEIIARLRNSRQLKETEVVKLCQRIQQSAAITNSQVGQTSMRSQITELCELYDSIIDGAVTDCEEHMNAINNMALMNGEHTISEVKQNGQLPSSSELESYYADTLQTLEKSNKELHQQLEQLQKNLSNKEQAMFNDTMTRLDNSSKQQVDKLKAQISELSQEMALQNVDNRALRERLLRTEGENEKLMKQLKESGQVDTEMRSLQENLDSQLGLNRSMEKKLKGLELVKMEHESICKRTKMELQEANKKLLQCETELTELRKKLREAKDMQLKFDFMNLHLNSKMEKLHNENSVLVDNLSKAEMTSANTTSQDTHNLAELESSINSLEQAKSQQQQKVKDLTQQFENSEKQRQNANMKVQALRERLKVMQDSWQKISTDTESSFSALRDQYQQQIKEYKSIIDSLKSQNTALSARIESIKKMNDQQTVSQSGHRTSLEQQITEYKRITEGYREENILLRKELKSVVTAKQTLEDEQLNSSNSTWRMSNSDEFAKLRDILTTAKSEVENLQITKSPRSRATSVERDSYQQEKERTNQTVQEIRDRYERLSPDHTASVETVKPVEVLRNKYKNYTTSSTQHKPLAESTPRNSRAKTAPSNSSYKSMTIKTDHTPPRIMTGSYKKHYQPIAPFSMTSAKPRNLAEPIIHDKSAYDKPSNIRSKRVEEKVTLPESSKSVAPVTLVRPQTISSARSSKKKEVVELKHSMSAELDLSKSFKPIEPDEGKKADPIQPSSHKTLHTSSYNSSYSLPYKSSYSANRDTAYRSSYDPAKRTVHRSEPLSSYSSKPVHITSSSDIYSSKPADSQSTSYSSISHHISTSYNRDPLPSISSIRSKYSRLPAQADPLSKLIATENRRTTRLNDELDYSQPTIGRVGLIANPGYYYEHYFNQNQMVEFY